MDTETQNIFLQNVTLILQHRITLAWTFFGCGLGLALIGVPILGWIISKLQPTAWQTVEFQIWPVKVSSSATVLISIICLVLFIPAALIESPNINSGKNGQDITNTRLTVDSQTISAPQIPIELATNKASAASIKSAFSESFSRAAGVAAETPMGNPNGLYKAIGVTLNDEPTTVDFGSMKVDYASPDKAEISLSARTKSSKVNMSYSGMRDNNLWIFTLNGAKISPVKDEQSQPNRKPPN